MKHIFKLFWYLAERIVLLIVWIYLSINLVIERLVKGLVILLIFLWDLKIKKKYIWWNQYHLCFYSIFKFTHLSLRLFLN